MATPSDPPPDRNADATRSVSASRLIRAAGPLPTIVSVLGAERISVSFHDRAKAYAQALVALEADIQTVAEGVQESSDGAFAWAMTPDWHRRDDLKGLVHWYYLVELVAALHDRAPVERLTIEDPVPTFVLLRLRRRLGVPVDEPVPVRVRRGGAWIAARLQAAGKLVRAISGRGAARRLNMRMFQRTLRESAPELLVQMPPPHMRHRYGPLLDNLSARYRVVSFGLDIRAKRRSRETRYNPSAHICPGDLIAVARRAYALRRKLTRLRASEPLPAMLIKPAVCDLMLAMADFRAIERMIEERAPHAVVLFWPVTRPKIRMVIEACRRGQVPVVLIPGRTLSGMKAAERLIPADRQTCRLDDPIVRVVVADPHSLDVLRRGGFADDQLLIGSTHAEKPASCPVGMSAEADCGSVLLVLLQADRAENRGLLKSLRSAFPRKSTYRVRVRAHPKMSLSSQEKSLIAAMDRDWQDVTGLAYQECISAGRTVAVTVFSTSGIDVAVHGCGLLWLPWVTDQAVTMADMIGAVGATIDNQRELMEKLADLQDNVHLEAFCERCKSQARAFAAEADVCEAFAVIERALP